MIDVNGILQRLGDYKCEGQLSLEDIHGCQDCIKKSCPSHGQQLPACEEYET